jgi:2-keto-3-deoxygluconate permease
VKIYQAVNRAPGGLMVRPLFIMPLDTFAPNALKRGCVTQGLTNVGYPTILAMYLFTAGTEMTLRAALKMLKRGFGILFAKVGIAVAPSSSSSARFGCASLRCTTNLADGAARVVSMPGPSGCYRCVVIASLLSERTYS